jgi:hypothetical protein
MPLRRPTEHARRCSRVIIVRIVLAGVVKHGTPQSDPIGETKSCRQHRLSAAPFPGRRHLGFVAE